MSETDGQALVAMVCAAIGIAAYYVQWFRMWLLKDYTPRGLHWIIQFAFGAAIGSMVVWLMMLAEG